MNFLHKHLKIFNITYTVSSFLLGLYKYRFISSSTILCSTYHNESFDKVINFTLFPIQTKPESFWTLGYVLTGKKSSFTLDSPEKKKMKKIPKYKGQALINIVSWNYVQQVLFLHKNCWIGIKTNKVTFQVLNAVIHKQVLNLAMSLFIGIQTLLFCGFLINCLWIY